MGVPWLILSNKLEEAEYIITHAAELNKVEIPQYMIDSLRKCNDKEQEIEKPRKFQEPQKSPRNMDDFRYMDDVTLCQALRSKRVLVNLIAFLCYWLTMPLVYYGVTLGAGNLAGDVYLNFFLLGVV